MKCEVVGERAVLCAFIPDIGTHHPGMALPRAVLVRFTLLLRQKCNDPFCGL